VYPELFSLGPITVYSYGVLLAASYLLGLRLAMTRAKKRGLDSNRVLDLGIYIIIAALVGAKLLLLVVDFDQFRRSPGRSLLAGARRWCLLRRVAALGRRGVLVHEPSPHAVLDDLRCVCAGDCAGPRDWSSRVHGCGLLLWQADERPWAIIFTNPLAAANVGTPLNIPLHPTQLYEAGAELLILIVLIATEKRWRPFPGRTFWAYMLLYAISRYIIEFYRGDPRGMVLGMSTSQFISLILGPLSLAMLAWLRRTSPETPNEMRGRRKAAA
jgi:phosphatidylglycerol:prolipoprotein diacylglycerol transferase